MIGAAWHGTSRTTVPLTARHDLLLAMMVRSCNAAANAAAALYRPTGSYRAKGVAA